MWGECINNGDTCLCTIQDYIFLGKISMRALLSALFCRLFFLN